MLFLFAIIIYYFVDDIIIFDTIVYWLFHWWRYIYDIFLHALPSLLSADIDTHTAQETGIGAYDRKRHGTKL